jgi:hypothetical protein
MLFKYVIIVLFVDKEENLSMLEVNSILFQTKLLLLSNLYGT